MNKLSRFLTVLFVGFCSLPHLLEAQTLRTLYPPIEPYQTGFLEVEGGHTLYWEESGSPEGQPILFLHGGPGLGTHSDNRCFFNPHYYRIILIDQRGCGKSTPFASLENNTTWDLVQDIEKVRIHLGIDKWILFGGSWGSTLALTYAIQHTRQVEALILRGVFLCRPEEIHWFYQDGANHIFPDFWEDYIAPIPLEERGDIVQSFYKYLTSSDPNQRAQATKAWVLWEAKTCKTKNHKVVFNSYNIRKAYSLGVIECHYFKNNAFFPSNNWILENIHAIRHIPCTIIQGRFDVVCPMQSAWDLHRAWPEAKFEIISDAGHSSTEPGILDTLIRATDSFITSPTSP